MISIALVVAAITTGIAYFVDWLPEQASEERQGIDLVFWVTVAICIFFFAVVAAVSIYSGVKFRVKPDDLSDGPPIHGHTGLEIVWTAVPTICVTVIAVLSAVVLAQNDSSKGKPLRVEVLAQQYAWQFTYPEEGGIKTTNLYLPIDRSTKLELTARDVLHSFWVPEFGQKQDAVPGIVTTVVITPTKTGEYRLICTELCGLGHALMRTRAIVLSQADFAAWTKKQPQAAAPPAAARSTRRGSSPRTARPVTRSRRRARTAWSARFSTTSPSHRRPSSTRFATAAAGCLRSEASSRMTRSKRSCSI